MGTLCAARRVYLHFLLPERDLHLLARFAKSRFARR
jgi:hypothetical protein